VAIEGFSGPCYERSVLNFRVSFPEHVGVVQNVNARGTIYSMWIILCKCEGGCEARLVRSIEQIW